MSYQAKGVAGRTIRCIVTVVRFASRQTSALVFAAVAALGVMLIVATAMTGTPSDGRHLLFPSSKTAETMPDSIQQNTSGSPNKPSSTQVTINGQTTQLPPNSSWQKTTDDGHTKVQIYTHNQQDATSMYSD